MYWNEAVKDYDEFYFAMLDSSRFEMDRWMIEINAQFLSQVAITVDRLNGVQQPNATAECLQKLRSESGSDIQIIIRDVKADIDYYQRDYVWLLLDVTHQYISFNQKWPKRIWSEFNMVMRMDIVTYLMETYVYLFYKTLFEAQVEEILIEMQRFNDLVNETRMRAFTALDNVGDRLERRLLSC
jgi:hypothetical protein